MKEPIDWLNTDLVSSQYSSVYINISKNKYKSYMLLNILTQRDIFPKVDLTYTSIILYFITEHNIALSEKILSITSASYITFYIEIIRRRNTFRKQIPHFNNLFYLNIQLILTAMEENKPLFRQVSIYLLLCDILYSDKMIS